MLLAAFLFLPWRLKVEIKRIYEIADQALALPPFFCKTVNPITTDQGGLDTKFHVFKMIAHLKKCFWLQPLSCHGGQK